MPRVRTLVLILAGGAGSRLELLTRERAKPAVPYAGTHRLIDFPLSNCHNSGTHDVWISQQFNAVSLSDHLSNGRPWDLDRTVGGLLLLQPRLGHDDRGGFAQGTADTLWRYAPVIRQFDPDALVVVSADAVYTLDYTALVEEHLDARDADVTMVTTRVQPDDAGRYGVVQVDGSGRVQDYVYKPDEPASDLVANEVFVFTPSRLLDMVEELAAEVGDEGLQDLGNELLPRMVEARAARAHRSEGYWRDVGTIEAYWSSHQELLVAEPPIDLDDPNWPIRTRPAKWSAAKVLRTASFDESILGPGATVAGTVTRSVIGRGVIVEEGATVRDSVLLPGSVVRSGATVQRAVIDESVEVSADAQVGAAEGDIALVGLGAVVPRGVELGAGARYPGDGEDE